MVMEIPIVHQYTMEQKFHMPLTKYMAKLCRIYDCFPSHLSPWIVLINVGARLLGKAFKVPFNYEEIIYRMMLKTSWDIEDDNG